jgi:DNA-binding LacI/PurR family transcriptional regulator
VRVSIAELGAAAAERVLYAVRTGTGHKRLHLTLPTTLVTRESSGSLPLMAGRKNRSHGTNGRRKGE